MVLFSATLGKEVQTLIDKYQTDPLYCEVGPESPDLTLMKHRFIKVNNENRLAVAAHFAKQANSSIVFCRTKHGCNRLARQLQNAGLKSGLIHGDRSQSQRTTALRRFSKGETNVLVATDVAARGIHVDDVDQVLHFDPPKEDSTYVHRSGRTARAGAEGVVVSLIKPNENKQSKRMRRNLEIDVEPEEAPEIDLEAFIAESKERSLTHDEQDRVAKRQRSNKRNSGGRGRNQRRSGGGRDDRRGGGNSRGNSKPRSRNRSDDDERSDRPSRGRKPKSGGSSRGKSNGRRGERSERSERSDRSEGSEARNWSPKPKSKRSGKPGGRKRSEGSKSNSRDDRPKRDRKPGRPVGKDGKPKSKRTGKPRPKNKNSRSTRSGGSKRPSNRS